MGSIVRLVQPSLIQASSSISVIHGRVLGTLVNKRERMAR